MAENFDDKDYGEYFRSLERDIERANSTTSEEPHLDFEEESYEENVVRFNKKRITAVVAVVLAVVIALSVAIASLSGSKVKPEPDADINATKDDVTEDVVRRPVVDENTVEPDEAIDSKHIIVIDTDTRKVIAARDCDVRTAPASTTKIMTALVAVENAKNFDDTFKMTLEITDPIFIAGATAAGFSVGEEISITDMLYGCILPSGGDAALGLAYKISGSEEAFVKLMNDKCEELGLKNTHFTNVTGLHDENHYSTASDMAVILEAAMREPMCRKLLSTFQYTTAETKQHPEGLTLTSTLFSYMYGTEPETAQIDGGKTGYVNQSGFCIASYGHAKDGSQYICVTLGGASRWTGVFDQIELYKAYAK